MAKQKRKNWIIALALVVIAVLVVAVWYKGKQRPRGELVEMEEVRKRTIKETVTASGRVYPEVEVSISSDISGEIIELNVLEGDSVQTGQILAKVDPEAFVSAVERGEASLNNTKSQMAMAQSAIQNSIAQKEQIAAQLSNAKKIHERNDVLKREGVISDAEFEQSLSNVQALEANLRASDASLKSSQKNAEASKFSVKSMEASLKELKTNLNKTTLTSPISGVVSSLLVEKGERVVGTMQFAGTEIMRIANLNSMEVQVEVSENDILKVSLDDSTEVEVDAYLNRSFLGVVSEIANSSINTGSSLGSLSSLNTDQVTNFVVKIRLDANSYADLLDNNSLFPFRPGMSASVDIVTEINKDVLSIPIQAVTVRDLNEGDESTSEEDIQEVVFVISSDTASQVLVSTGIQDDEYITINEGLEDGQKVVTGPYSAISKKLKNGLQLRVDEEKDKKENN